MTTRRSSFARHLRRSLVILFLLSLPRIASAQVTEQYWVEGHYEDVWYEGEYVSTGYFIYILVEPGYWREAMQPSGGTYWEWVEDVWEEVWIDDVQWIEPRWEQVWVPGQWQTESVPNHEWSDLLRKVNEGGFYPTVDQFWSYPLGRNYGMSDLAHFATAPDQMAHNRIMSEAARRGVITAKSTIHGPLTEDQVRKINQSFERAERLLNTQIGITSALAALGLRLGPVPSILVGAGTSVLVDAPTRERLRAGDTVIITGIIIYGNPQAGIPVGSSVEVRIVNRNLPYENNTGQTVFTGQETELIYDAAIRAETSGPVDNNIGVRITNGPDGKIRIDPIR